MNDNRLLIRALRGPLTLIVVGGLFAIDHAGIYRFGQTWPVLVILIGCLTLLERSGNQTAGGAQ
ncbi:MAG: hypothetical protein FJW30_01940 [Acidobacteria bacterium]|nr:hypothetical protein [Acidobacteriota bacterium]